MFVSPSVGPRSRRGKIHGTPSHVGHHLHFSTATPPIVDPHAETATFRSGSTTSLCGLPDPPALPIRASLLNQHGLSPKRQHEPRTLTDRRRTPPRRRAGLPDSMQSAWLPSGGIRLLNVSLPGACEALPSAATGLEAASLIGLPWRRYLSYGILGYTYIIYVRT
jgi:hypothetical protein